MKKNLLLFCIILASCSVNQNNNSFTVKDKIPNPNESLPNVKVSLEELSNAPIVKESITSDSRNVKE